MSSTVSCVSYTKHSHNVGWLVVSTPQYESVGMIIPNIWKNKKCSKPPTTWQIYQNIQKHSKTWGVPNNGGGYPKSWMVYNEKSDNKTDDLGVPPWLRKPPHPKRYHHNTLGADDPSFIRTSLADWKMARITPKLKLSGKKNTIVW